MTTKTDVTGIGIGIGTDDGIGDKFGGKTTMRKI
jgi:hypothetical protein